MFSKILYPTDFSDVAARALGYFKQLREAGIKDIQQHLAEALPVFEAATAKRGTRK